MADINFVSQRVRKLTNLEQQDQQVFKIVAIITSVILLIFTGISSYKLYLNSRLKKIENSQTTLLNQIKQEEDTEKSFVLFVNKLRVLSEIFQERKDKQDAINYFSQIFGPDVTIGRIAYDAESELISFRLMSADVFTLENVFTLLASDQSTQKFSSLNKTNLQRTTSGVYAMQVTVMLDQSE